MLNVQLCEAKASDDVYATCQWLVVTDGRGDRYEIALDRTKGRLTVLGIRGRRIKVKRITSNCVRITEAEMD